MTQNVLTILHNSDALSEIVSLVFIRVPRNNSFENEFNFALSIVILILVL